MRLTAALVGPTFAALVGPTFAALSVATQIATQIAAPAIRSNWDVVVVGGGPAGLAAASALGRVRRNVLLVDSGEYRDANTRRIQDVLGFDGVTPAFFRWQARRQLQHYPTVKLTNGTVHSIVTASDGRGATLFTVHIERPVALPQSTVTTRKVILATGLKDLIPSTPGLAENFGQGIYWTPWCEGFEHIDQPLGILASLEKASALIYTALSLNTDIVIFANGTDTAANRAAAQSILPGFDKWLDLHRITVDNRTIASVERLSEHAPKGDRAPGGLILYHDQFRVNFEQGDSIQRAAFLVKWEVEQRSRLGEQLGIRLVRGRLESNITRGMATNVPGVWAAGDANSDQITNIAHAIWSGKRAAVSLHVTMERENAISQIDSM